MQSSKMTLIDKLRIHLENPNIAVKVKENMATRLFSDLPEEFDNILSDSTGDSIELIQILKNIPKSHAINPVISGQKPDFKLESDRLMIELWAKRIISILCSELLDDKNDIKSDLLNILNALPKTVSSHDLICSYFSNASQYYIKAVTNSGEIDNINTDVFYAFIEYINNYVDWVTDVFKDRLTDPDKSYEVRKHEALPSSNNLDVAIEVGAGLLMFGVFSALGFLAYEAYKNSKDHESQNDHSSSGNKK